MSTTLLKGSSIKLGHEINLLMMICKKKPRKKIQLVKRQGQDGADASFPTTLHVNFIT